MRNKKFYLTMVALIAIFIIHGLINARHFVTMNTANIGEIRIEASDAKANQGGIGYLTLEDGQAIAITADMTESALLVEVFVEGEDGEAEGVYSESFSGTETEQLSLPAAQYAVRITSEAGATGHLFIEAVDE
ncbi:MAG: hypothetical protein IIY36_05730 [Lachnospiraceae bacterium]|nr:hypothetical protein [Lachnospiraceae bacterium]